MEKMKILFVDDEANIRKLMKLMLEKQGFEVVTADNGESGYQAALKTKPHIIITDLMMPHKDGIDLTKSIRSSELKNIPIIMVSATHEEAKRKAAFDAGVNDFLNKPVSIPQLKEKIAEFISW